MGSQPQRCLMCFSTSIAMDNVFKLAALLDWDANCSFGNPFLRLLSDVFFAVLAWPPLLPNSAEKCCFSSTLPLLCCWRLFLNYKLLSWCLYRGAVDYGQSHNRAAILCSMAALPLSHAPVSLAERLRWDHVPKLQEKPSTRRISKRAVIQTRSTPLPET